MNLYKQLTSSSISIRNWEEYSKIGKKKSDEILFLRNDYYD